LFCLAVPATPDIFPLSLHDALPISASLAGMHIRAPNGTWIRGTFDRRDGGQVHALSVRRLVLDATLLDMARAAGAFVHERSLVRSEEHTSELQSRENLVCRLLLEKK